MTEKLPGSPEIAQIDIDAIIPYAQNNRIHDEAQIARIAKSITDFGFNQPIVLDEEYTILVGHGRFLAAQKLGLIKIPAVIRGGLTNVQKQAYRILDNKIQNDSQWDFANLKLELDALALESFALNDWGLDNLQSLTDAFFNPQEVEQPHESKYIKKIEAPVYVPTGERPELSALADTEKYNKLISEIQAAENVPDDVKVFLCQSAMRHIVFDYQQIAEYFAHAPKNIQLLMERLALVIIDFNGAIEGGFVRMSEELAKSFTESAKELANESK